MRRRRSIPIRVGPEFQEWFFGTYLPDLMRQGKRDISSPEATDEIARTMKNNGHRRKIDII